MCDVWIIESSETYSSLEHEFLKDNLSNEISLEIEELHPREALNKLNNNIYPNIVILDTIIPSAKTDILISKIKSKNPETKCMLVSSDRRQFKIANIPTIDKPFLPSVFIALFKEVYNSTIL